MQKNRALLLFYFCHFIKTFALIKFSQEDFFFFFQNVGYVKTSNEKWWLKE